MAQVGVDIENVIEKYKRFHDDESFNEIYEKYSPLIKSTASAYSATVPKNLLEAEGKILLSQAIDKYDPTRRNFTPYLSSYMKGMQRIANAASPIYVPEIRVNRLRMYIDEKESLSQKLKRPPTVEELADHLRLPPNEVRRLSQETGRTAVSGIDEGILSSWGFEDKYEMPNEYVLEHVFNKLDNPQDRRILEFVYGIHGKPELKTNKAIGDRVGLSESGVRKAKDRIIDVMQKEFVK